MNKIVAIVGMCGSGKSVVTSVFNEMGEESVYFGGVTMDRLKELGLPRNEANERMVREGLRKEHGSAAFAKLLCPTIEEKVKHSNVALDGLYSWSEYKCLKDKFGDTLTVLAVVTNRNKRYERLAKREIRPLKPEEAKSRDYSEIENSEKGGPISIADIYLLNNASVDELRENTKKIINNL